MGQINFRIDDATKAEAESLFASLGMNTTTALMVFIRQSIAEHAIPFAVRQVPPVRNYAEELTSRIRDMEAGRNCHVHELIDIDQTHRTMNARHHTRSTRHAKTLA